LQDRKKTFFLYQVFLTFQNKIFITLIKIHIRIDCVTHMYILAKKKMIKKYLLLSQHTYVPDNICAIVVYMAQDPTISL